MTAKEKLSDLFSGKPTQRKAIIEQLAIDPELAALTWGGAPFDAMVFVCQNVITSASITNRKTKETRQLTAEQWQRHFENLEGSDPVKVNPDWIGQIVRFQVPPGTTDKKSDPIE